MKKCTLCGNSFASTIIIDGKRRNLANRKYCLICSPFGEHNTSPLEKPKVDGIAIIQSKCRSCEEVFSYKRKTTSILKRKRSICNTCQVNNRRPIRKQKAIVLKGHKCLVCGYNKCISALDFHHLDPSLKDTAIAKLYLSNIEKFIIELNKCVLLCCRCHSEHHAGIISTEELISLEKARQKLNHI